MVHCCHQKSTVCEPKPDISLLLCCCCCWCCTLPPLPPPLKVFVANPNKPQPIVDILTNNRDKLLKYLEDFHTDRGEHLLLVDQLPAPHLSPPSPPLPNPTHCCAVLLAA